MDFFTTEDKEVAGSERENCFPALEEEEEEDRDDEVGVIFFISATRAEARFFTMASRSD